MNIEDLPPDIVVAILEYANRTRHDTHWKANVKLTPTMERIYKDIVYRCLIIGAVKGYELGREEE